MAAVVAAVERYKMAELPVQEAAAVTEMRCRP
jgi:hypothetical protein